MTTTTLTEYGPDKPCQRTACADGAPHLGGAHLDPRNPLYDGPETALNALPHACRKAGWDLLSASRADGWRRQFVDVALHEMAREILRLRQQIAAVQVDKDRQVRAASKRALDCEEHGKDIRRLEEQVHHFDREADRNDAGRLALLNGFHALEDAVRSLQESVRRGDKVPDLAKVLDVFAKAIERAYAAHKRAWSK